MGLADRRVHASTVVCVFGCEVEAKYIKYNFILLTFHLSFRLNQLILNDNGITSVELGNKVQGLYFVLVGTAVKLPPNSNDSSTCNN